MAEQTPRTRNRVAVSGRVAQRLSGSTLILSERVYLDDWGLKASTTDLRFVVDASRRVFEDPLAESLTGVIRMGWTSTVTMASSQLDGVAISQMP